MGRSKNGQRKARTPNATPTRAPPPKTQPGPSGRQRATAAKAPSEEGDALLALRACSERRERRRATE